MKFCLIRSILARVPTITLVLQSQLAYAGSEVRKPSVDCASINGQLMIAGQTFAGVPLMASELRSR
eukprot:3370337-Pleurochrysis_carterae.AAC.1